MQAIIFMGIQASGKSSFYKEHFFNSHVRISMDLFNTRHKESEFLKTCIQTQSRFVIDNTNPTFCEREKYITLAKTHQYEIVGYYFSTSLLDALHRNSLRRGKQRIPDAGIRACSAKLEHPNFEEGFDKLYFVQFSENGFKIEDWKDNM